jgi:two-component system sensor histidine kinase/response regulator
MDSIDNFNLKSDENLYQFLSSAVEQSFEGTAVADLEGTLIYVNPAWAKMHGYESGEELIGQSLKIFHNDEQLEKDVLTFNEIVKEKGAHTGEVGHIRRDGTPFPTLMTTTLLKDGQGKPVAILGMAKDISEQKKYEIELIEEKNKYEAVITALRDGITLHDRNYRIIFQNDVHKERQGDHIGEICYEAYQKRESICPGCVVEKTLADGLPHWRESRAPGKDGSTIYMEVTSSPVFNANGEIVSVVELVRDISHFKKAEE